ncbi:MAG: metal-dependent transcriptional regulator [Mycobacteriales bacterium]
MPLLAHDPSHHPPVEEYLETIYHLAESGVPAMRARLVERLGVSAPAVSEQVRRLEREGYVTLEADRTVHLTATGASYATALVRRHRLAERLLVDVLGLPWHQVHEEAGRLEHAISPVLEARLVAVLGDPATCPHGNPIPGSAKAADPGPLLPLTRLPTGATAEVVRIEEELQADRDALVALEAARALPGAVVTVLDRSADGLTIRAPAGELTLSLRAAEAVLVRG